MKAMILTYCQQEPIICMSPQPHLPSAAAFLPTEDSVKCDSGLGFTSSPGEAVSCTAPVRPTGP